jgi:hypothetical protein
MPLYLGKKGQGYIVQIGFCQRCGWKYLRTELTEDDYIKGLLVCIYCHDPDQPQRYSVEPRAEGFPPLLPSPDQYPGPNATVLSGSYTSGTVNLSWTPSVDNADLINEYFVYRQTNGGPGVLIASVPFETTLEFINGEQQWVNSPTVYADDTVEAGNTYAYYVIADAVDHRLSPPSNTWMLVPAPVLTGQLSGENVLLNWSGPPVVTVASYQLYRGINGANPTLLTTTAGNVFTYTDTSAEAGEPNAYYVVAILAAGQSLPSNTVTETPSGPIIVTSQTGLFYVGAFEANGTGYSDGGEQPLPYSFDGHPFPVGSISSTVLGHLFIGSIGVSSGELILGLYSGNLASPPTELNFTSMTIAGKTYTQADVFFTQAPAYGNTDHSLFYITLQGSNPFSNGEPTEITFTGVT